MNRRITLTISDEEMFDLLRLREQLDADCPLATFAASVLVSSVDCELFHSQQCMASVLIEWRPEGRPN